jgi:hypothetical protein
MQNGYIESFNGRMRDELLSESLPKGVTLAEALKPLDESSVAGQWATY